MGEDLKGEGSGAVLKLGMEGGRDAVLIDFARRSSARWMLTSVILWEKGEGGRCGIETCGGVGGGRDTSHTD